jgi:hypothetical protein
MGTEPPAVYEHEELAIGKDLVAVMVVVKHTYSLDRRLV